MQGCIKFFLFIFFCYFQGQAAPQSDLAQKKSIVEKHLKTKIPFTKKVKLLVAFQTWADKEILSNSDHLTEEDLTEVMQYSSLLKTLNPQKLSRKNCKGSINKVLEEDTNPTTEEPSKPALTIKNWLVVLCAY